MEEQRIYRHVIRRHCLRKTIPAVELKALFHRILNRRDFGTYLQVKRIVLFAFHHIFKHKYILLKLGCDIQVAIDYNITFLISVAVAPLHETELQIRIGNSSELGAFSISAVLKTYRTAISRTDLNIKISVHNQFVGIRGKTDSLISFKSHRHAFNDSIIRAALLPQLKSNCFPICLIAADTHVETIIGIGQNLRDTSAFIAHKCSHLIIRGSIPRSGISKREFKIETHVVTIIGRIDSPRGSESPLQRADRHYKHNQHHKRISNCFLHW